MKMNRGYKVNLYVRKFKNQLKQYKRLIKE